MTVRWKRGSMEGNYVFMVVICWVNVPSGRECVWIVNVKWWCEWANTIQWLNVDSWGWIIQKVKLFLNHAKRVWISWLKRAECCLSLSLPPSPFTLSCSACRLLSICIVYHESNISKRLDCPHEVRPGWLRCFLVWDAVCALGPAGWIWVVSVQVS